MIFWDEKTNSAGWWKEVVKLIIDYCNLARKFVCLWGSKYSYIICHVVFRRQPAEVFFSKKIVKWKQVSTNTVKILQSTWISRPLVKVVTPLVRMLANLCASPAASEKVCLIIINHPDLTAILMALLGTNYTHLVRESLWWFSNMINSDSVVVQEQFVELNIMDRLEFHTIQAVQKIDPYAPIIIH